MEAQRAHVLIGGVEPGAEDLHGAEPRQDPHPAVLQKGQELPRPAEEPAVPAEDHREPAAVRVLPDALGNGLRSDGPAGPLSRCGVLEHPLRADEAVRPGDGPADLPGHGLRASGADARQGHPGPETEAEALFQKGHGGRKVQALPLGRTAHHHQDRPGVPGGGGLLLEAAGASGVLGDQIFCPHGAEHGRVHLPGEGALHGDDVVRGQSRLLAGPQGRLHRQDPGVTTPGKIQQAGIFLQFFTSGSQKDVPLRALQVRHSALDVRHPDRALRIPGGGPQEAQVLRPRPLTGGGDVLRHGGGVGVGGVHHQVELLPPEQFLHLLLCQPLMGDGQALPRRQEAPAVLRGHAGGDGDAFSLQELDELPALGGPGEDAQLLTHPGTPWGSPARRQ